MPRGRPKGSGKQVQAVPVQYDSALTVEELAKELIPQFHSHLVNAKISYLFKNKEITKSGREVIATAEKCNPKVKHLTGMDFIITVAYPTWQNLTDNQKKATIDHELMHCLVDDDDETGETKFKIVAHDLEEFLLCIERWGLIREDLAALGRVVSKQTTPEKPKVIIKDQTN